VTLTTNTDYTVRTKVTSGVTINLLEARMIVVQTSAWPSTITATETQIELGDDFSTTSTSYVKPTDTRYWSLPQVSGGTKYDGSPLCYFEGTLATSSAAATATAALVGTAGSGSPLATAASTSTTGARVRSAAFTCNTAQDVHVELKSGAGSATAFLLNGRIIIDQNASGLSKLETYLPVRSSQSTVTGTTFSTGPPFLWEPANYASSPAADMTVTAPYYGVAYSTTGASGSTQLCNQGSGGCGTGTAVSGSAQSALTSAAVAWAKSGAVTLPASSTEIAAQHKSSTAGGTFNIREGYVPVDVVFTGSLQFLASPTTTTLPGVTLNGTQQTTSAGVGNIRVKDNRPGAPGWTLTAQSGNFTSSGNTILASKATIAPVAATTPNSSSLTGVTAGAGGTLDAARTLMSASAGNGLGTYDQNPTESVVVDTVVRTGTYSATLTLTLA
jgi:hypothetical protein